MKKSEFNGSAWGLFGWSILIAISIMLFLIPVVFVVPKYVKWYYEHTKFDGKQLSFEYEGPWWGFLGWLLFSYVTLGIGAFYAQKRMIQWEISNVHVQGEEHLDSEFNGSAWGILGWGFASAISIYAFLIPYAFVIVLIQKWYKKNAVVNGKQLEFEYEGAWWGALGWLFFSIITLGIGSFYAQKRIIQWEVSNTHFVEQE